MADRVSVSITLGGRLSAAQYVELAAVIVAEGLSVEWDGPAFETEHRAEGEPLSLYANEVAWGRIEALERFCSEHGLPYRFWSGGFFAEWGAERIVYRGEGTPHSFIADESDRILIDRREVERRGSLDAILAYFMEAEFEVPPLVIEGDDPVADAAAEQKGSVGHG